MGCVSSKLFKKELERDVIFNNNIGGGDSSINHVVSLTSTTYGALKLGQNERELQQQAKEEEPVKEIVVESKGLKKSPPRDEQPEVINAWELMRDLEVEEELVPISNHLKKSPKSRVFLNVDARSPLKFLNQIGSPRKAKTFGGKENKVKKAPDFSPRPVSKSNKAVLKLNYSVKGSSIGTKSEATPENVSGISSRRSFSPLFDPELVALYERELSEEEEQVKRVISATPRVQKLKNAQELESMLLSFERKLPPGGENSVVIYTTTLRGIRKTFEDCNAVRSIVESYCIQVLERDISMDSGFKEELRRLMGTKEVKVPLLFVKGRLVGGTEQVVKLEEEGKLGILFDGVPRMLAGACGGCAGFRFVMCRECSGSCKVLDEEKKTTLRCGLCNENGLVQCPLCC